MADLASRADFIFGSVLVSPSTRAVRGPGGGALLEPRVMQVLVILAEADGAVVTRDTLFARCWGGIYVGDDSLNRAVAAVRRVFAKIGGGSVAVETIPRTGYRLTKGEAREADIVPQVAPTERTANLPRRWLLAGGLAAAIGGLGFLSLRHDRTDPRVAELIERAEAALRYAMPDGDAQGVAFLRRAVAIEPDNADAWGLLALALRNAAENASPAEAAAAVAAADRAARRALALDAREGNALAALATLRPSFGDWINAEDRLLQVLDVVPDNVAAISALVLLLQQVGRRRDSWRWNERAAELDPLSPVHQYRRGLKLWIFGRVNEADQTIDRALQLWPQHPAVWNARMLIFAFTDRAPAGLAMLDDVNSRPPTLEAPTIAFWRISLTALDTRSPDDVALARRANLEAAPRSPGFATNAIMMLSALGEIDAAFAVAEGYLLRRGPLVGTLWTGSGQMPVNDSRWRRNMMLFTPVAAPLRADPRFAALCDGIGLTAYWRRRGIRPD